MAFAKESSFDQGIGLDGTIVAPAAAPPALAAVDISGVAPPAFVALWESFLAEFPRNALSLTVSLTNGNDRFRGEPGNTNVFAGRGDDRIVTRDENDIVFAGSGNDTVSSGFGADIIDGGLGNDLINAGCWSDYVNGGRGDDTILGGNVDDVIFGHLGNDSMFGENGDDILYVIEDSILGRRTGSQRDFFDGGAAFDTVALRLTAETRALVEAELAAAAGPVTRIEALNLDLASVERIEFIDDWTDLYDLGALARLEEANALGILF